MFRPTLITPPQGRPVSVVDAKAHGVVDYSDDDTLIETYIEAATGYLDGFRGILGRCIITQTWQVERRDLPLRFELPVPDVSSVTIKYDDFDGVEQTVPAELVSLHLVAIGTRIRIDDTFPTPRLDDTEAPVRVQFTAGFGDMVAVPQPIKLAIMQLTRHWYDHRSPVHVGSAVNSVPMGFDMLIAPWRWMRA